MRGVVVPTDIWNDSAAVIYVKLYDALIGDVTRTRS